MRDRAGDAVRVLVAFLAVLALCVVVGVASTSRRAGTAPDVPFDGRAAAALIGAVTFVVFAGFLAMAVRVLLRLLRRDGDGEDEDEDEQASALEVTTPVWLQRLIMAGLLAMIALCAWITWLVVKSFLDVPPPPGGDGAAPAPARPVVSGFDGGGILPDVAVYVLVALILALVVLTVLVALRRPAADDEVGWADVELPGPEAEVVEDPFTVDLESLRLRPPRAAVIVAFALAQRMLGGAGFGAQWDETSAEHVQRVGPALPGAAAPALDHLLGLYHEAKFSAHPITPRHRSDAVSALDQLRAALLPLALAPTGRGGA